MEAGKEMIAVKQKVNMNVISHDTPFIRKLRGFVLSGNPNKAKDQLIELMNAFNHDYSKTLSNYRKNQMDLYFVNHFCQLLELISQCETSHYAEIYTQVNEYLANVISRNDHWLPYIENARERMFSNS